MNGDTRMILDQIMGLDKRMGAQHKETGEKIDKIHGRIDKAIEDIGDIKTNAVRTQTQVEGIMAARPCPEVKDAASEIEGVKKSMTDHAKEHKKDFKDMVAGAAKFILAMVSGVLIYWIIDAVGLK